MSEESWHEARLIPTSGISGAEEQERRATSALLAVMGAVREYGRALTKGVGAPAGTVQTYVEVPFELAERRLFPDGLISVSRGQKSWTALVEVKTGANKLAPDQLENYLDIAREQGFDAVVTISNEIPAIPGQHPTTVDRRKLRKVQLHHWSWTEVLAEAVMQKEHRGVADPDQAWILGELIRYLEHPRSGALEFEDMSEAWVSVRDAVSTGTLRPTNKGVGEVAARFDALLRFASLRLGRQLGAEVTPVLTRAEVADPARRTQDMVSSLCDQGVLVGSIRIPEAVAPIVVTADLRAARITCHVNVDAPREGRPATRVKWLVRQLADAPNAVRVESYVAHGRGSSAAELLGATRDNPGLLLPPGGKELRSFRVAVTMPMGAKRGRGRGSFIDSTLATIDAFYSDVLQSLKAWSAAPPKLRQPDAEVIATEQPAPASLVSTSFSSQDEPRYEDYYREPVEPSSEERPPVEPGEMEATHDLGGNTGAAQS